MQTTLSEQITAIQKARAIVNSKKFHAEVDKGLNDAASTIAALKMVASQFESASQEEKNRIATEFFRRLYNAI